MRGALRSCLALALPVLAGLGTLAASQAQADTATDSLYVSNLDVGTDHTDWSSGSFAQRFSTGASTTGHPLGRIEVVSADPEGDRFGVRVCSVNSNGFPDFLECTLLQAPDSFAAGTLVFTAPEGTTLAGETTYTVVVSSPATGITRVDYVTTRNNGEDEGSQQGWSIRDRLDHSTLSGWEEAGVGRSLRIAVKGLRPATVPGAPTNLTATTPTSGGVSLNWEAPSEDGGSAITHYEYRFHPGKTVPDDTPWITVGEVTETVPGVVDRQEYTFEVRAVNSVGEGPAASVRATPRRIDMLVSNSTLRLADISSAVQAQLFSTGSNAGGFLIDWVTVHTVNWSTGVTAADVKSARTPAAIWTVGSDNRPDRVLVVLEPPDTYVRGAAHRFTAPAGTILAPNTTYALVFNHWTRRQNRLSLGHVTSSGSESEFGWSIHDRRRSGTIGGTVPWTHGSFSNRQGAIQLTVRGVAVADVTLSGLSMREGGTAGEILELSPAFDPWVLEYTAKVDPGTDALAVTANVNSRDASVVFLDGAGTVLTPPLGLGFTRTFDLGAGLNVFKAVVTATDDSSEQIYTFSVTRPDCAVDPGDRTEMWYGEVAVGEIRSGNVTAGYGFNGAEGVGALSDVDFRVEGPYTEYGIHEVEGVWVEPDGDLVLDLSDSVLGITDANETKYFPALRLQTCNASFALADAEYANGVHTWPGSGLDWSAETAVSLSLTASPDTALSGLSLADVPDFYNREEFYFADGSLTPEFASNITAYDALVGYEPGWVTILTTPNDPGTRIRVGRYNTESPFGPDGGFLFDIDPQDGYHINSRQFGSGWVIYEVIVISGDRAHTRSYYLNIWQWGNRDPLFLEEGAVATREVVENTAVGQPVGAPVAAEDWDQHTLTYTLCPAGLAPDFDLLEGCSPIQLSGSDAAHFSLDAATGQLFTATVLDYENPVDKNGDGVYRVTIAVADGHGGSRRMSVRVRVTDQGSTVPVTGLSDASTAENGSWTSPAPMAPDATGAVTWTKSGPDAARFTQGANGAVTLPAQNYESPADADSGNDYEVTVVATDSEGGDGQMSITVTVTDVAEKPDRPAAPTVTATANTTDSLDVSWTAPGLNGGPAITGYRLRHRVSGPGPWSEGTEVLTGTTGTIDGLDEDTEYAVQVLAQNGETDSEWGVAGRGSTGSSTNVGPEFDTASTSRVVAENTTSGQNVGAPVAATDTDTGDTLTYSLEGTDQASFGIDSATGQILTDAALNHEAKATYSVTVKVIDGRGGEATIAVTVIVEDIDEQPERPAAPNVGGISGTTDGLAVSWTAPGLNGGPEITGYRLRHQTGTEPWSEETLSGTDTAATIAGLQEDTEYAVQVLAENGETDSDWSVSGQGRTCTDNAPTVANAIPDQRATAGTAFHYPFPANTFNDADICDTLAYTAARSDDSPLPAWLAFNGSTRTFSGTPGTADVGTLTVKVTASDVNESVDDLFDIVVSATPPVVADDWPLKPPGLTPGDRFRLIFASSTTRGALSTDIADYNTFVQNRAAEGHSAIQSYSSGFRVVGCTATVDARDSTSTTYTTTDMGVPIYWLDGNRVADDYADFYDGDWDDEVDSKDEFGDDRPLSGLPIYYPFTGCDHDGTKLPDSLALGELLVAIGIANSSSAGHGPISSDSAALGATGGPFYGLSGVFQVAGTPSEVPEDWSLKPDAVGPGGKFRLLFVSSTTRDATSTDIADYNAHVQSAAAAGHADIQDYSADFTAIGSTTAVNARENTLTRSTDPDAPIYWVDESATRDAVADDYGDFWGNTGSATTWVNTSPRTEGGDSATMNSDATAVITGTDRDGMASAGFRLGASNVRGWYYTAARLRATSVLNTEERGLLALSPVFVVSSEPPVTNSAPTSADATVTTAQDTAHVFSAADFPFEDADAGDTLSSVTVVTLPTVGSLALAGTAVTAGDAVTAAELAASDLVFTPAAGGSGSPYATFTFTVSDGTDASALAYTMTINVRAATHEVPGDWTLKPDAVGPGDEFRLLFASSTTRNATLADIADYNSFVQTAAAAGHADIQSHSSGFRVVGCTEDVDARDNTSTTGTGVPIYWLDGNKVADDYADFYDGSWDDEANPKDESGSDRDLSTAANRPYTGCFHDGTEEFTSGTSGALGTTAIPAFVQVGSPNVATVGPIQGDAHSPATSARPFYGLSPVFVVSSTPVTNSVPTSADATVSTAQDTAHVFSAGDFPFEDADAGDTLSSVTVVTLPTVGSLELDGTAVTAGGAVTATQLGADDLVFTPAAGGSGSPYATFTFTVSDGTDASASAYTMTINVRAATHEVPGDWTLKPDAVGPGGKFRLLFVSSTTRSGGSADIADYNTHVQSAAAAGHADIRAYSADFTAIGSTSAVNARTNTLTRSTDPDAPIYWVEALATRTAVADDYADFYGSWGNVSGRDQTGASMGLSSANGPITGTNLNGTTASNQALGTTHSDRLVTYWYVNGNVLQTGVVTKSTTRPILGISPVFVVSSTPPASSDASLSALMLSEGTLDPAFASQQYAYDASVALATGRITVTPTTSHSAATVAYQDASGAALADADGVATNGHQVDLAAGANTVNVVVTAEDSVTTLTYALTVWRPACAVPLGGRTEIWASEIAVEKVRSGPAIVGYGYHSAALAGGLSSGRDFEFGGTDYSVRGELWVDTNEGLVLTLDVPEADFAALRLHACGDAFGLAASTFSGNTLHTWADTGLDWSSETGVSVALSASPDATLSGLSLSTGTLSPTFASDVLAYTATVPNATARITVTPTVNEAGAKVDYRDGNDAVLADADAITEGQQVDLVAGGNPIKLLVTSGDRANTKTYTVTVTREAAPVNNAPVFTEGASTSRSVAENTASGNNVGAAVTATDDDTSDSLTYSLEGTDQASFGIVATTGQILTSAALNHEAKSSYSVRMKVVDNAGAADTIAVTVNVTDLNEKPERPAAPDVEATANTSVSLNVSWTEPGLNGGPAITGYKLQYKTGSEQWTEKTLAGTDTMATIDGLKGDTPYEVQVQALNGETPSDWSLSGTGRTSVNNAPVFTDGTATTRSVAENTQADQPVGTPVAATDADTGDTLTYSKTGADAAEFGLNDETGQLLTATVFDYEGAVDANDDGVYEVTVSVTDGNGGTDSIAVSVTVTDLPETSTVTVTGLDDDSTEENEPWISPAPTVSGAIGDVTWSKSGADAARFTLAADGKVTLPAQSYESPADANRDNDYEVTVKATDSDGNAGDQSITVTVMDVDEKPERPAAPAVNATAGTTDSLDVSWRKPGLNGGPDITGYRLRRRSDGGSWTSTTPSGIRTSTTIGGLVEDTEYEVQVLAVNGEIDSDWSRSGTGTPGVRTEADVSFSSSVYEAVEGGAAARVTVRLSAAPGRSMAIPLVATHLGGASRADHDVPPSVAFGATDTSASFAVTATDDALDDDGESVRIRFGTLPDGISEGDTREATVRLRDNDGSASGFATFQMGTSPMSAPEGYGSALVVLQLTRRNGRVLEGGLDGDVTIPLTTTHLGGATAADYTGVPPSVTIPAGRSEHELHVRPVDDDEDDDGEAIVIGFGTLPAALSPGPMPTKRVDFVDTDERAAWHVSFGAAAYTAAEGGAAATVAVLLDAPWKPWLGEALTLPIEVSAHGGGATAADYSGLPPDVTIAEGATRGTFTVTAVDDGDDDDGESVTLGFSLARFPEDLRLGRGPSEAVVSLADDDGVEPLTVSFGAASYTAEEGSGGVWVELRLDRAADRSLNVPLTTTLRGASTSDFQGVLEAVPFVAGEMTRSFAVTATDDDEDDDGESVDIGFGLLPEAVTAGDPAVATVHLEDNDGDTPSYEVRFDAHASVVCPVREGGSCRVHARLTPAPDSALSLPLVATHLDGATAADYSGLPAQLVFEAGEKKSGFSVFGVDDTEADPGEGLRVGFGDLPKGVRGEDGWDTATFRIIDNDGPPGVSIGDASARERPGDSPYSDLVFRLTLDRSAEETGSVRWATADGTATAGEDYVAASGTATFGPGSEHVDIRVETIYDEVAEGDETMTVALSDPQKLRLADAVGTGTILDARASSGVADAFVSGARLTLRYGEALDATSTPGPKDWVVRATSGTGARALAVTAVSVKGADAVLSLSPPAVSGEAVTLDYLPWAMHPLLDGDGVEAAPLTDLAVRNETPRPRLPEAPAGAQAPPDNAADLPRLPPGEVLLAALLAENPIRLDLRSLNLADVSALAGLVDLEALDLSGNAVSDAWPLAGLANLRRLNLSGNRIADVSALAGLAGLEALDVSDNAVSDAWPLSGLVNLKRLDLSGNPLGDVSALAGLAGLEVLVLDGGGVAEVLPLALLPQLKRLDLSGNALADVTLLAELRRLKRLDLSGNRIAEVDGLGDLSHLLWLDLTGNPVADAAPLGRLTMLRWLWLDAELTGLEALAPLRERPAPVRIEARAPAGPAARAGH